jgi:hypothetical protein
VHEAAHVFGPKKGGSSKVKATKFIRQFKFSDVNKRLNSNKPATPLALSSAPGWFWHTS